MSTKLEPVGFALFTKEGGVLGLYATERAANCVRTSKYGWDREDPRLPHEYWGLARRLRGERAVRCAPVFAVTEAPE